MRKVTRYLLWLFVFSVPWGIVNSLEGLGTITRLVGMATIGAGVLTTVVEGRVRKPGVIFWFALVFAVSSVLTLFWTISYNATVERAGTYIQFVGLIWVMREFARTREEQQSLMLAFCLGGFVFAFDLFRNFAAGVQVKPNETRFSASGINSNYVGFTLVLGFPMAWYLLFHRRWPVITSIFCFVAPLGILLTAGRTSFVAGLVAVSIVPLTLGRGSFRSLMRLMALLIVAAVTIGLVVPRRSWDRVLATATEATSGTMSGRTLIWDAGRRAFQERPLLGSGAGSFPLAVEPVIYRPRGAHNVPLALLVEQGIVGLCIFVSLLGACAWVIIRLPPPERLLWAVLMLTWLILGYSGDTHPEKGTWILFGLLAAQEPVSTFRRRIVGTHTEYAKAAAGQAFQRPVPVGVFHHDR